MFDLNILPYAFLVGFFFALGACFGSFANVVILRMPVSKSVIKPSSHCIRCLKPIKWFDNIPMISYLILMGKCRNCGAKFSWRYFLVELLMACGFAGFFYWHGLSFYLLEHLVFFFSLVVVSFIDFDHMILPDEFTLSGIAIGLVGSLLNDGRSFWDAFVGVLIGGGFLWAVAYIYFALRKQEGMGGGDIKLLAWIGAVLGWQSIPYVILFSCIVGSIVGVVLSFKSAKGMQTVIPFGPYLALGAVTYIFGGQGLGHLYIKWFLPGLV